MTSLLVRVSAVAILLGGLTVLPLASADDEVKGSVPSRANANDPNSAVYRVSDVIDLPVKDDSGAEVGRIKDLVVNGESREVLYAVVAMNDAKEKDALYVMPWNAFRPSYGQNAIQYTVLLLPSTVWVQAPFYSPAQWRQATFSQWGPRVNSYNSKHLPQNSAANSRPQGVRVNKPAIDGDDSEGTNTPKTKPAPGDKKEDKPGKDGDKPAKDGDKPGKADPDKVNPKPQPKPEPAPKDPETPGRKIETPPKSPAPKTSEAPAPKAADPIVPKKPPVPRDPKLPSNPN